VEKLEENAFGKFLVRKRLERDMTMRGLAEKIGVSAVYLSKIENGRKHAPPEATLQRIADLLCFDRQETDEMHDLAALSKKKPSVSGDLPEYIMERDVVRIALRTAKDADATDQEWIDFTERLKKRMIPNETNPRKDDGS